MKTKDPLKKLLPLAGLASFEQASLPGLSVEKCVKRLKRFHYSLWRLHQICIAHIASGVLDNWKEWKDQGLTGHRNWWPNLYTAWCVAQGRTPAPEVLAFDLSYDGQRADLKHVSSIAPANP